MIEKREVWVVVCECGEALDAHGDGGYTVFDSEETAKRAAENDEWEISDDGKVTCGYCADERDKK